MATVTVGWVLRIAWCRLVDLKLFRQNTFNVCHIIVFVTGFKIWTSKLLCKLWV